MSWTRVPRVSLRSRDRLSLLHGLFNRADHVERLLRKIVVLAFCNVSAALDRVLEFHILAFKTGKLGGDEEWLREEALNLSRAGHNQFIFI